MFSGVPSYGSELSGFTGSVRQEKFIHFPNLWICDIPLAHGKFSFGSLMKIEGYWNFKWEKLVTQIRAHLELGLFLLWTYFVCLSTTRNWNFYSHLLEFFNVASTNCHVKQQILFLWDSLTTRLTCIQFKVLQPRNTNCMLM